MNVGLKSPDVTLPIWGTRNVADIANRSHTSGSKISRKSRVPILAASIRCEVDVD